MANRITINGESFIVNGNDVSIVNGYVYVGGRAISDQLHGEVNIKWEGELVSLKTDYGSVTCGDVKGNVEAGGSVNCKSVDGNVNAGGSVNAVGHIGRNINAGGSVRINQV